MKWRHLPASLPLPPADHLHHEVDQDVCVDQKRDLSPHPQGQETTAVQSPEQDFQRREQLPALHLGDAGNNVSSQSDSFRPQRIRKKLSKF